MSHENACTRRLLRHHAPEAIALGALVTLAMTTAGCPKPTDKPSEPRWRSQAVSLDVKGFALNGGGAKAQSWVGSGVFVAPGIIATNAHVAARALEIAGADDLKRPHVFDKILASDVEQDLALLKSEYVANDITPAKLLPRGDDPRDLRGTEIFAVGNTGGLGLSLYEGRVVNVVSFPYGERVMHDGQIAGGSSGGPLFMKGTDSLVGINHAGNARLKFSIAIPSWYVSEWLGKRGGAPGKKLADAFKLTKDIGLINEVKREICLDPGKSIQVPMNYSNGTDFLLGVVPKNLPVIYGLAVAANNTSQVIEKGLLKETALRALTAPIPAQYVLVLGGHPAAPQPTCVQFVIGQIDWGKQVNK